MDLTPRFPVYIPSKSRAEIAVTPKALNRMGVPYRLVVEENQADDYARVWGDDKVLVLDPQYQRDYVTCDDEGDSISKGSGPARNFIWDHSLAEGHRFHWIMDDNIPVFYSVTQNQQRVAGGPWIFHAMESFVLRYKNVGMAGPEYEQFVPMRQKSPPFRTGCKIYSCLLIRNEVPLRWECRYNEDVDLGLRMLKDGWVTVAFLAFLQKKMATQMLPGGNTEAFYKQEGTLPKSEMLVRRHPDVARIGRRYRRWHHYVDYSRFRGMPLVPDPDYEPEMAKYEVKEVPQDERLLAGITLWNSGHKYSEGSKK